MKNKHDLTRLPVSRFLGQTECFLRVGSWFPKLNAYSLQPHSSCEGNRLGTLLWEEQLLQPTPSQFSAWKPCWGIISPNYLFHMRYLRGKTPCDKPEFISFKAVTFSLALWETAMKVQSVSILFKFIVLIKEAAEIIEAKKRGAKRCLTATKWLMIIVFLPAYLPPPSSSGLHCYLHHCSKLSLAVVTICGEPEYGNSAWAMIHDLAMHLPIKMSLFQLQNILAEVTCYNCFSVLTHSVPLVFCQS